MDDPWVFLIETDNDLEADIVCGLLHERGIPARKTDSSPYTGAMRVIGGLAYEVQVIVPRALLEEALALLEELEEGCEE